MSIDVTDNTETQILREKWTSRGVPSTLFDAMVAEANAEYNSVIGYGDYARFSMLTVNITDEDETEDCFYLIAVLTDMFIIMGACTQDTTYVFGQLPAIDLTVEVLKINNANTKVIAMGYANISHSKDESLSVTISTTNLECPLPPTPIIGVCIGYTHKAFTTIKTAIQSLISKISNETSTTEIHNNDWLLFLSYSNLESTTSPTQELILTEVGTTYPTEFTPNFAKGYVVGAANGLKFDGVNCGTTNPSTGTVSYEVPSQTKNTIHVLKDNFAKGWYANVVGTTTDGYKSTTTGASMSLTRSGSNNKWYLDGNYIQTSTTYICPAQSDGTGHSINCTT